MSNLAIKVFKTFFTRSGWIELREFLHKTIEHEEEMMKRMNKGVEYNEAMLVSLHDMKRRQDEAIALANIAVRKYNELLREAKKFMSSNTFWKDESIQ